jgi:hypothetical protein
MIQLKYLKNSWKLYSLYSLFGLQETDLPMSWGPKFEAGPVDLSQKKYLDRQILELIP